MLRPDHNTGNSVRYSFPTGRAFFYVLQARESNHLQMQLQRQHFLLNYLKIWVLVQGQRQLPDPSATGVIQGLFHWPHILWLRLLSCYCTSRQDVLPDLTRALFMVRGSNELGIFGCQLLLYNESVRSNTGRVVFVWSWHFEELWLLSFSANCAVMILTISCLWRQISCIVVLR